MSHPLVEILDRIQDEFVRLLSSETEPEQKKIALRMILMHLSARDLAVAKAVRDAILERTRRGWEKLPALSLAEIIKGVK